MLSDAQLYPRVREGLAAEIALFGSASSGAALLCPAGVIASRAPVAPDRSVFNSVLSESLAALAGAYDELFAGYAASGVRAFTVWLDPGDDAGGSFLLARGHVLDAEPYAMAAELDALQLSRPGSLAWEESRDAALVGRLNDAAYGAPPPAFEAALQRLPANVRAYVAREGGEPVSCLLAIDSGQGNCGISAVATLPPARGRGLATALLAQALRDARARGCTTTTLQATSKGMPVYAALGYRTLGRMAMWEHRKPRP